MLNLYNRKLMHNRIIVRVLLAAFSIAIFAAPNTLADYGSKSACAGFGAYDSYDFTSDGGFAENFPRENSETQPDYTATSLLPAPAAEYNMAAQSSCAPKYRCFSGGGWTECWYDLLNNEGFVGTSCSPDWVFQNGYHPSLTRVCTADPLPRSAYIVVLPNAGTFYQNFSVPYAVTKPLEISMIFETSGSATFWDRVHLQLWEGNTFLEQTRITSNFPSCERADYTFSKSYAGKNLRLVVSPSIVTSGVEYHIQLIQISAYL